MAINNGAVSINNHRTAETIKENAMTFEIEKPRTHGIWFAPATLLTLLMAFARPAIVMAQPAVIRGPALEERRLPGERVTVKQRQALAAFSADIAIAFGEQEVPTFISGLLSARKYPHDPAAEAQAALEAHGAAFRRGGGDGFIVKAIELDKSGKTAVRMRQTYKGIAVIGGELTVHLSNENVVGISGRFVPDLHSPVTFTGSPSQATARALGFMAREGYQNARTAGKPEPAIYVDKNNLEYAVFLVEVEHDGDEGTERENLFADEATGEVLDRQTLGPMSTTPGCPTFQICSTPANLLLNPGFELGNDGTSWQTDSGTNPEVFHRSWNDSGDPCNTGAWCAWLNGYGGISAERTYQAVQIPSNATAVTLEFYLRIVTDDHGLAANDTLNVELWTFQENVYGVYIKPVSLIARVATYSNAGPFATGNYVRRSIDLTQFRGRLFALVFSGKENSTLATSFYIDDVKLSVK